MTDLEILDGWSPTIQNDEPEKRKIITPWGTERKLPMRGGILTQAKNIDRYYKRILEADISDEWDVTAANDAWQCIESIFDFISYWATNKNIQHYFENRPGDSQLDKAAVLQDAALPSAGIFYDIYYASEPDDECQALFPGICGSAVDHLIEIKQIELFESGGIFISATEESKDELKDHIEQLRHLHYDARGDQVGFCIKNRTTKKIKFVAPITEENAKSTVLPIFKKTLNEIRKYLSDKPELKALKKHLPIYPNEKEVQHQRLIREMKAKKEKQQEREDEFVMADDEGRKKIFREYLSKVGIESQIEIATDTEDWVTKNMEYPD